MVLYCYNCMQPIENNPSICPHCGQAPFGDNPVHQLKTGTLLKNRYLIGKALGQGGFGITYIGLDTKLDLRVAIKEYYPREFSNRNHEVSANVSVTSGKDLYTHGKECFLQEAKNLAKFNNEPGIVGVRDFFEANNTAYLVMEYIDGITLKKEIVTLKKFTHENGILQEKELLNMMQPMIRTLSKMHEKGIIHRDISPDNIIMLSDGTLKLLDFGAAREIGDDKSLSVLLKPGYTPYEQYSSKGNQGPWTDVYALCATMYYCLTGVVPEASVDRMESDDLIQPSKLGARIHPALESVILRGMAVRARDRYQSMKELEDALLTATSLHSDLDQPKLPAPKKSRWVLILGIFVLAVLLAFLGKILYPHLKLFGYSRNSDISSQTSLDNQETKDANGAISAAITPISITEQPINAIAKSGDISAFSVVADGDDLSYQWQTRTSSGEYWSNSSGEGCRTPVLSVNTGALEVKLGHCYYRCLITDKAGNSVSSETASLIVWAFDEDTKTLTVKGGGSMPDWNSSKAPWYKVCQDATTIIIEDGIENIGAYAFWGTADHGSQATIYIPRTVESISTHALEGWIKDFEVNSDNPVYCSIDGALFNKSGLTLIRVPGGRSGRYIVPEGTRIIDNYAFEWCRYLHEIEFPNGITIIGNYAFYGCQWLNKLILPDGLQTIGDHIFEHEAMYMLRPVIYIPRSVEFIGENRFGYYREKKEVYYSGTEEDWHKIHFAAPEGITGDYIFYCLPDDHSDTDTNHYSWFDYAGRWVSGQRSESTGNYYEEELTIRCTGSTSFVFTWHKHDVAELTDLRATIDPETGIAAFDDELYLARNKGRGTITLKDGTVTLHIETSSQNDKVPDGYEVTFNIKESDRLQSAKWFA